MRSNAVFSDLFLFLKHLLHFAIFQQHPIIPLGTKPAPARSAPQIQTQEIDFKLTWTIASAIQQRTDGDGRIDESTGNRSSSIGSRQDHCTNGKAVELVPTSHKSAGPIRSRFTDIRISITRALKIYTKNTA